MIEYTLTTIFQIFISFSETQYIEIMWQNLFVVQQKYSDYFLRWIHQIQWKVQIAKQGELRNS